MWLSQKEIGETVKLIREQVGLTQEELAVRLGLAGGQQLVSKWERGIKRPGYEKMRQVAGLVARDVDVFQVGSDLAGGGASIGEAIRQLVDERVTSPRVRELVRLYSNTSALRSYGGRVTYRDALTAARAVAVDEKFSAAELEELDTLVPVILELTESHERAVRP